MPLMVCNGKYTEKPAITLLFPSPRYLITWRFMKENLQHKWKLCWNTFLSNYVICALFGLFVVGTFKAHENEIAIIYSTNITRFIIAMLSGFLVMCIVGIFYLILQWQYKKRINKDLHHGEKWLIRMKVTLFVGFITGASNIYFFTSEWSIFLLTLIILVLVFLHLHRFMRTIVRVLRPGNYPTWSDIGQMMHVYMTILAAFTMITISLTIAHHFVPDSSPAFSISASPHLIIDAFYFNVVVMTTLGFGDITPLTTEARLWISFECLISYFMFGLLIGTITKGIASSPE